MQTSSSFFALAYVYSRIMHKRIKQTTDCTLKFRDEWKEETNYEKKKKVGPFSISSSEMLDDLCFSYKQIQWT